MYLVRSVGRQGTFSSMTNLLAAPAIAPVAHVKWYVEDPTGADLDLSFALSPLTLGLTAVAVLTVIGWRAVAVRKAPVPEISRLSFLGRLAPWIARILAIHLGVSLLSLSVADAYLSPGLSVEDVPGGWLIVLVQAVIGVWLITGVALRPAAVAVIALGPLGLLLAGPVPVLEGIDRLGVAVFLLLLPPGRDAHGARPVTAEQLRLPIFALRLGVGIALVVLAFSEKLLVPDLMRELLAERPYLDPLQGLGLTDSPDLFIVVASVTELALGLLIISGAAPQLVVFAAGVPFNVTLIFFDRFELIGHLPVYGALLALLVYGSHPELARSVRDLAPWRARPGGPGQAAGEGEVEALVSPPGG